MSYSWQVSPLRLRTCWYTIFSLDWHTIHENEWEDIFWWYAEGCLVYGSELFDYIKQQIMGRANWCRCQVIRYQELWPEYHPVDGLLRMPSTCSQQLSLRPAYAEGKATAQKIWTMELNYKSICSKQTKMKKKIQLKYVIWKILNKKHCRKRQFTKSL